MFDVRPRVEETTATPSDVAPLPLGPGTSRSGRCQGLVFGIADNPLVEGCLENEHFISMGTSGKGGAVNTGLTVCEGWSGVSSLRRRMICQIKCSLFRSIM